MSAFMGRPEGRFQLEKGNKRKSLGRIKSSLGDEKKSQPLDYPRVISFSRTRREPGRKMDVRKPG